MKDYRVSSSQALLWTEPAAVKFHSAVPIADPTIETHSVIKSYCRTAEAEATGAPRQTNCYQTESGKEHHERRTSVES